ncbi:hydrogenase maturation protease [Dysgonomonas sp. PFB1-18]|uniref:HyaD/HybD family hydrogenase maturation endopeptidase n=1 Tax=unclassified Dysgonomonas TaxID=2630389 RepID=UPI00247484E7|nr:MULTISPECIES: HyaD/HybD family hydrogenase maturation endopeptidase [unclassified Dysgonomonas]MDL2303001.1 HyaD/HybD family hydrogenase maturation endopeptidase [Dysgonomonas sp. OttesenSCG-928-D17]MDH6309572.1 hydrogenase maturation protease [Dysgonomonas sp. PF1-14]MDH6339100.1 hydrogenase maturation protease [Dysgonomonas sp. PF1-16]MDH6380614.1 hydrogenase maturation protease [Dysgonomonas sp. PFB1-18]MDH6398110.1 hydrogenase maturation protease [Dysgonomonas sp. PF1-23]
MNTLILGVGNLLLKDEGVGIHVIRALEQENLPSGVHLMDGGTGGFHLISWIEKYDRIIMIDATLDKNPPGTVRVLRPKYSSEFPPLMSAHEIGLRDMMSIMELTETMPLIDLIVISVEDISEVGMELTPAVKKVIPEVVEKIKQMTL